MSNDLLLSVRNLRTVFKTEDGIFPAVDGIDFDLDRGETIGIVGESGCGKSVTSLSIMKLIPDPPGRIADGEIIFEGRDLVGMTEQQMMSIRGNDISMIFQEPMTSLNPVFTVGSQIIEVLTIHQNMHKHQAREKAIDMLRLVGIPSPEKRIDDYPHQLSGGMRQRVMIAMALACNPKLLIADEPTTALDVTIQAQILELMKNLNRELGTAIMLITHDLGVVAEVVDKVIVMYAGKIVEKAPVGRLFDEPSHPYTIGLLNSIPKLNQAQERLQVIEGVVPSPYNMPAGCRFAPRCKMAKPICSQSEPELVKLGGDQYARCWQYTTSW